MRKLIWFSAGFAAACGMVAYALVRSIGLAMLFLGLAAVAGVLGRKWAMFYRVRLVCLGMAVGAAWVFAFGLLYLNAAETADGTIGEFALHIADYSEQTAYGTAADAQIILDGKPYQVRAYFREDRLLEPGDTLTGRFRVRLTTPDGAQPGTYHAGKGIFLLLYEERDTVEQGPRQQTLRDLPAVVRFRVLESLEACMPADAYPFSKALLLGDTSDLSYEVSTSFKISGISHVVAVSGLHVSILFALLSFVSIHRRFFMALIGFPVLILFAAVAGFTPSVTRACIMAGLMLLAMLLSREYDGPSALAFAVLVMLAVNPLVIMNVGFQLSVSSVAGIYLFHDRIRMWLRARFGKLRSRSPKARLADWFSGSVAITLSATVMTAPLCALYFGAVSLVGIVTNLLVLWVIAFIFYGLMAVCVLHFLWNAGAVLLAKAVAVPIRYVITVAGAMAKLPLAAVYTRSAYIVAWLVFVYVLLLLFAFCRNRKVETLVCCAVLGLCISLLASWWEPISENVCLTVLDVGQGQCLLLQSDGKTYMVDCGGDSDQRTADLAAETLLSRGISRLDGLILTHRDRDHAGGVPYFLSRIDTDLLILPPAQGETLPSGAGETLYVSEDLFLSFGSARVSVFASDFPETSNENSLCVLFETESCVILITGDRSGFGERMLLRHENIPKVNVLIAGHHGAKNATCEALLEQTRPEIVCISVGEGNFYGHPAPELLQRLERFGCQVYRTDQMGDILIRR